MNDPDIDLAILTSDEDCNITANPAAQNVWDLPGAYVGRIAPEDWGPAFHVYDPVTRMPLSSALLPAYRAIFEGEVEAELLICVPGRPDRIISSYAKAEYDQDGECVGMTNVSRDITKEWMARSEQRPATYAVLLCPCDRWQVEAPTNVPCEWLMEALEEHMNQCVVLTATRMTIQSGC